MPKYAIIENENVLNVIIASSIEDASSLTEHAAVLVPEGDLNAEPGGTYSGGVFIKKKPYPSWVLNNEKAWVPPVAWSGEELAEYEILVWDEENVSWRIEQNLDVMASVQSQA